MDLFSLSRSCIFRHSRSLVDWLCASIIDDVLLYAYLLSDIVHTYHISTLLGGHLSTFSIFVHSTLFVNKHWQHINNTSLFIFIFFRLPARPHWPFINYRKCCPSEPTALLGKEKECPRSRPLIMMNHQKTIQSSSYQAMTGKIMCSLFH